MSRAGGGAPAPPFIRLPAWALEEIPALGATGLLVLCAIARHQDRDGRCRPSTKLLGKLTGLKRRAIFTALDRLTRCGLLVRESVPGRASGYLVVHEPPVRGDARVEGANPCAAAHWSRAGRAPTCTSPVRGDARPLELDPSKPEKSSSSTAAGPLGQFSTGPKEESTSSSEALLSRMSPGDAEQLRLYAKGKGVATPLEILAGACQSHHQGKIKAPFKSLQTWIDSQARYEAERRQTGPRPVRQEGAPALRALGLTAENLAAYEER